MNEYLKTVLEQIRCKKARPYIQQELQEHIECQIEKNICDGMDYERAEKEAVKDMGDPIETGILLDRIHKPQIAWTLLFLIVLLSVVGVMTHTMITRHIDEATSSISSQYIIHVVVGIMVMLGIYFVDYHIISKNFKTDRCYIHGDMLTNFVFWRVYRWCDMLDQNRGMGYIHTGIDVVLCSNVWRNYLSILWSKLSWISQSNHMDDCSSSSCFTDAINDVSKFDVDIDACDVDNSHLQ